MGAVDSTWLVKSHISVWVQVAWTRPQCENRLIYTLTIQVFLSTHVLFQPPKKRRFDGWFTWVRNQHFGFCLSKDFLVIEQSRPNKNRNAIGALEREKRVFTSASDLTNGNNGTAGLWSELFFQK